MKKNVHFGVHSFISMYNIFMGNLEKCIKILNRLNADAMVLSNEANMHYICNFSPSEGRIVIFSNGDAFHIVDSRYTEVAKVYSKDTGLTVIEMEQPMSHHVSDLMDEYDASSLVYENDTISLLQYNSYVDNMSNVEFKKLDNLLMLERNKKEQYEIDYMKNANNIAEKAFMELLNHVKVGKTEKELAAYFDYLMAKEGSDGVSFDTILLTGSHTSMPHGVPSDKTIEEGDFILFDFGATYKGYHSDMTRTIAVGNATDEMKEMYDLVLKAQNTCIKMFNEGVKCFDLYKKACDIFEEKGMKEYFRHGLGHGVGLDIHEGFKANSVSKDTYEIGNVTSIEPGLYIPDKFGIRIEDVCYLSPHGRENLSKVTKQLIVL